MNIYIVNGFPEAGKDSFIDLCMEELKPRVAIKASSVDVVKQAAKMLGWNGEKDLRGRMFLSDLKDLSTAAYDGPMNCLRYAVQVSREAQAAALFVLIREPEEIARFVSEFPETKTVLVERPSEHRGASCPCGHEEIVQHDDGSGSCIGSHCPQEFSNHADAGVEDYAYDIRVANDKDLNNLRYRAKKFLKEVGL